MGRFAITIDEAGLVAQLQVMPGPVATVADLHAWLASQGVVFGVEEDVLQALAPHLGDPEFFDARVVARGVAAQAGTAGELRGELLGGPVAGRMHASQRMDYRERSTLQPITAGQIVAEVVAPTAGTPGRDVRGGVLPATPGRADLPRLGAGVRLDNDRIIAARDGVVLLTDETLDVVELHTHEGDVDYASGNLHTHGSLMIEGGIGTGFHVTARGDVAVAGDVQGGGVTAGGSVHVARAILGCADVIRAGADITCHHTAASRLYADRSIAVADQVHEATLQAPVIAVHGGRGSVRGANLRARDHIHVATAGTPTGATTVLAVAQLLDERKEHARRTVASARLARAATRSGRSKDVRAALRAGDHDRTEMLRLRRRQRQLMASATIEVDGACHEGVVIRFGTVEFRPEEALHAVTFRWDPDKVEICYGGQS